MEMCRLSHGKITAFRLPPGRKFLHFQRRELQHAPKHCHFYVSSLTLHLGIATCSWQCLWQIFERSAFSPRSQLLGTKLPLLQ